MNRRVGMRVRIPFLLALLASSSAGLAQPATPPWNPKAPENRELLPGFTVTNVGTVLTAVGARFARSGGDPEKPALLATLANGRKVLVTLSGCDARSLCKGLSLQSFWTKSVTVPPEKTLQAIAQFNQRYAFAKALVTPDGRPSLERYLTADYGFVTGNLAVNLLVFGDQAERLATEYLQPLARAAKAP